MKSDILVLAEHFKGTITDTTFEMLGAGRRIADELNFSLSAILIGNEVSPYSSQLGIADKVIIVEEENIDLAEPVLFAQILNKVFEEREISLFLIGGTNLSSGIGPMLSIRTRLPYINFCQGLKVENGLLKVTSQLYGGKIFSSVSLVDNKGIISMYPGSFSADDGKSENSPELEKPEYMVENGKCKFIRFIEPEISDVDITKENVLVAVGRGIANADNIEMAEELASLLKGAVCGSRPVIDQGWLPLNRLVGKSGMTVKPKLYIALGISGAPEHVEGIKNADLIIAVNTDPDAPIFNVAHYGIHTEIEDIVPSVIEKLKPK